MFAVPALPQKKPSSTTSSSADPPATPPPLNYNEPEWSAPPRPSLAFEVIKNGATIDSLKLPKTSHNYCTIGRLPICDFPLEHPSVSRYHAVLQFKSDGTAYIYDLGSSHHTRLNKKIVPPRQHVRIRTGDQLRFGESTRTFCLLGDKELDDEQREREREEAEERRRRTTETTTESDGISWGFTDDATEEPEEDDVTTLPAGMRPFFLREADAHLGRENSDGSNFKGDENAFYRKDPKKALRNYLEHRGIPVQYETEEDGPGHARIYTSRIHLGFEDDSGPVYGNGTAGRRRESEQLAALNAMEKLDGLGMLKTKAQGSDPQIDARKKRLKALLRENDEDENFYDRTGSADRNRKKKNGNSLPVVETYDSLLEKKRSLEDKEADLENRVTVAEEKKKVAAARKASGPKDDDDIENYLATLKESEKIENVVDLQRQLKECKKEGERLDKLLRVAKPSTSRGMPELIRRAATETIVSPRQKSANEATSEAKLAHDDESSCPAQVNGSSSPMSDVTSPGDAATGTGEMQQNALKADIKMPPPVISSIKKAIDEAGPSTSTPSRTEIVRPTSAGSVKRRRAPMGPSFPTPSNGSLSQTDREEHEKAKEIEDEKDRQGSEDDLIDPAKRLKLDIAERMARGGLIRHEKGQEADGGNDMESGAERKRRRMASTAAPLDDRTSDSRDAKVDEKETDVEEWVPPVGQSGDGYTSLNAKYGY